MLTARKDGQLLKRGDKMKGFKTFPIQIPDEFHSKIKAMAEHSNKSIYGFIMDAVGEAVSFEEKKIEREGKK